MPLACISRFSGFRFFIQDPHFDFLVPGRSLGQGFAIVLATALAWSAGWEARFAAGRTRQAAALFPLDAAGLFRLVVSGSRRVAFSTDPC